MTEPLSVRLLGRAVPGLGVLLTAGIILVVGAIATNVFGKRVLQRAEYYLLQVPVFKTIYAPVKQLVAAFSPDNDAGFKKVVIVEDPKRGHDARVSDQGVHAAIAAAAPSRSWRSTCRPITCISATWSCIRASRCFIPT